MSPGRPGAGRGSGAPRRIALAVEELISQAEPQTVLARVQTHWAPACGSEVAERARPVAEREGTVTVACASATWAQELDLMQMELLRRVNERLESPAISAFRFIVDGDLHER